MSPTKSVGKKGKGGGMATVAPGPRVLSLKQPWAWAVATGRKRVENRDWSTAYRGTVYIHASMKLDRAAVDWLHRELRLKAPDNFVHGAVVAVATIEAVVTKERAARFGKWFFGKYGFVLSDVQALRQPVSTTGRLGLARASSLLQRRVERALKT